MFTGLIESTGEVINTHAIGGDVRIVISTHGFQTKNIAIGDSVAVNGVCLTAVVIEDGVDAACSVSFDVSKESIAHTLIADWQCGQIVNLELALLPTSRLGGHIVSGHVDGVVTLQRIAQDARSVRMAFAVPVELDKYIAKKGSVTLDGISLTVNQVRNCVFDVNIVPHTFQKTNLANLRLNDKVHIEVDLLARYLEKLLTCKGESHPSITVDTLADNGFI